ncbi:oligosaccharide flippase family protein [Clostridium gasigenes]|uniref:oligosaccharide flippase family protein n=1 Tax=Clostridium gasigenes TaxID=94869 RepID=UPI0016270E05|nr:oligosaccharide flippase family protein [Clostridium gasigenes]MBB6624640.1 oligosaccharide flippase family protein [Clostridium gasigenes]MBU3088473.1 oligosaccharide flippase family protein [Clostridium gasigenes]
MNKHINKDMINSLLKKGLLQIFSANIINKIVQFATIIFLTRIISQTEYGLFSYAQNTMNIAMLLEGLGVTAGILQYCSVEKEDGKKFVFFNYGTKVGMLINLVTSLGIMAWAAWGPLAMEGSRTFLFIMSFIPLLSITYGSIQAYLRSTLRNKEFSRLTVFNTVAYFVFTVGFSAIMGANGLILGMYLAYLSTVILGAFIIRKDIFLYKNTKMESKDKKIQFLKYSIITVLSNAMSQILYLLDTQLIGTFTKDPIIIANYKNATTIPFNLTFIPLSLIVFAYPYFAQNRNNKVWMKEKLSLLVKGLGVVNLFITIFGLVFAEPIFAIVFPKYMDAIPCFRVLMVGYFVSATFRIPYGNILASVGNVKANLINAIFSGVCNVILDIILIIKYGSIGAAYATLIVFIISSMIHYIFIRRYMNSIDVTEIV